MVKELNFGGLIAGIPIVQGGMGVGISLSGLASAVAREGGVGVISSAGLGLLYRRLSNNYNKASILGLREEITKAREKGKGIIGVNIMVAMSNYADMVKTSIDSGADIIFSGAGLPLDLPSYVTEGCQTRLVPIVSSARAARLLIEKWYANYKYIPDAIVVEGPKAGGHLGYKESQISDEHYSLETILPEVVAAVSEYEAKYERQIPVIAAGGIYTGEDIFRMMELGASGVQLGTRFVTTEECDASEAFKQTYIDAQERDIEIIRSPVGMPGRAILSKFIMDVRSGKTQPKRCPYHCIKTCDISKSPYCIMLALFHAFKGNFQRGYAFAGANAYKAEKITTVKETISSLMSEFGEKLKSKLK